MPRFTLFHRGRVERSFSVDAETIRIGRLPGLEVRLETPTVSREHARIVREGAAFAIEDAGSVNGVFVRGQKVARHRLAPGDVIAIEDYTLVFEPSEEVFRSGLPKVQPAPPDHADAGSDPNMTFLNIQRFLPKD